MNLLWAFTVQDMGPGYGTDTDCQTIPENKLLLPRRENSLRIGQNTDEFAAGSRSAGSISE
jgi:hypothetical protein